jgi:hypothetical protein
MSQRGLTNFPPVPCHRLTVEYAHYEGPNAQKLGAQLTVEHAIIWWLSVLYFTLCLD